MNPNTESTRLDRLRMAVGTILGTVGALILAVEGAAFHSAHLPVTFVAVLLILSGLLIAGSYTFAHLISNLLQK